MTAAQAERLRKNLVKLLRRWRDDSGRSARLADVMDRCTPSDPCLSAACPTCWRALQRLLVEISRPHMPAHTFSFITCISGAEATPMSKLEASRSIARTKQRILAAASRAPLRIFGAIDIGVNEHEIGRFLPHFQAHPHIFAPSAAFARHRYFFEQCFSAHRLVDQPVFAKTYDGSDLTRAYAVKMPTRKRRSLLPGKTRSGKKKRSTQHKPLNQAQRVELANTLHFAEFDSRIVMYGYEVLTDGRRVLMVTVTRRRAEQLRRQRQMKAAECLTRVQARQRDIERDEQKRLSELGSNRSLWKNNKRMR